MGLLHKELTYQVRGCIFDVHSEMRTGFDEESYHLALEHQLYKSNIYFQSKPIYFLEHRGKKIHKFIPDFIVENTLILEIKNIQSAFVPANYLQIISYLKHLQKDLGLLVNFGSLSAKIDRIPFSEKELMFKEDYTEIEDFINSSNRKYFELVQTAIFTVFEMYGLGYDYSIYKKLFHTELNFQNIPFSPSVSIPVKYSGKLLRHFELKIPIISNKIICGITAGETNLKSHIAAMKNYLSNTKIPIGIIANFGKEKLELKGVHL